MVALGQRQARAQQARARKRGSPLLRGRPFDIFVFKNWRIGR